jgi:hypothetical protein
MTMMMVCFTDFNDYKFLLILFSNLQIDDDDEDEPVATGNQAPGAGNQAASGDDDGKFQISNIILNLMIKNSTQMMMMTMTISSHFSMDSWGMMMVR